MSLRKEGEEKEREGTEGKMKRKDKAERKEG